MHFASSTAFNVIRKITPGRSSRKKKRNKFLSLLYDILEDPTSSKTARWWYKTTLIMALSSIALFYSETIPEFHNYGPATTLCKTVVETFCETSSTTDAGCFVQNEGEYLGENINFRCDVDEKERKDCYAIGINFGSVNWTCQDAFSSDTSVCNRRQCATNHIMRFDGAMLWQYFEWLFGIFFTIELVLRMIVTNSYREFFTDTFNIIDAACVFPFYVEAYETFILGKTPTYAIVPSDISFLELMKLLKTFRILKLARVRNYIIIKLKLNLFLIKRCIAFLWYFCASTDL